VSIRDRVGQLVAALIFWVHLSRPLTALIWDQAGAAGDVKVAYGASSALTQTNLDGLASSSTHVAGWESNAIDNSSDKYLDYIINAKIQVESAGLAAGEIRMYLVAELEDSTWPDVFDGTESGETVTDTEIRDAICRPAAWTATDTTASRTYYLNCPSVAAVFGGVCPRKFVVFITQSSGAALETTGDPNQVYIKGVYNTVAQS
jgi:hypothetical protein